MAADRITKTVIKLLMVQNSFSFVFDFLCMILPIVGNLHPKIAFPAAIGQNNIIEGKNFFLGHFQNSLTIGRIGGDRLDTVCIGRIGGDQQL